MNKFKTLCLLLLSLPIHSMNRMQRKTANRVMPKLIHVNQYTLTPKAHAAFSGYDSRAWDPNIHEPKALDSFIYTASHHKPELLAMQSIAHQNAKTGSMPTLFTHPYHGNNAVADYRQGAIGLNTKFHALPPASQYLTLLHEYRHYLQDINGLLDNPNFMPAQFYDKKTIEKSKGHPGHLHIEDDADRFAATQCTCPTCLKVAAVFISQRPSKVLDKGYFSLQDLVPFIQATKNNPCCPAHSKTPGNETHNEIVRELHERLEEYAKTLHMQNVKQIQDVLMDEISELDAKSGTLLQHIPDFSRNLLQAIAQHQEFHAMLGHQLLKKIARRDALKQQKPQTQLETPAQQARRAYETIRHLDLPQPRPLVENMHHWE